MLHVAGVHSGAILYELSREGHALSEDGRDSGNLTARGGYLAIFNDVHSSSIYLIDITVAIKTKSRG